MNPDVYKRQEDDFVIYLLHRNVVVLNTLEAFLHLVQLMVVRGKQGGEKLQAY